MYSKKKITIKDSVSYFDILTSSFISLIATTIGHILWLTKRDADVIKYFKQAIFLIINYYYKLKCYACKI